MLFRSIALVLLFIIRLRFPRELSLATIVRKRYGDDTLKDVRRFEKLDRRCRKLEIDIDYIETCVRHDVMPKFVRFRTANSNLRKSSTYVDCQKRLLQTELSNKNNALNESKKELDIVYTKLRRQLSYLDFGHIHSVITNGNELKIELVKATQSKKLEKLILDYNKDNPGTNIFNFSSHVLTDAQTALLSKGLNYAIPPKNLRYEDYLIPFEMLFRNIDETGKLPKDNKLFFKNSLKETCFSSFNNYNKSKQNNMNITKEEFNALKELKNVENLIIQKSDKGNSVVLIDKEIYVGKMKSILNDKQKFLELNLTENEILKKLLKTQDKIKACLDPLLKENIIDAKTYYRLLPKGSQPGKMYGLCKVHKASTDGSPPFRPILSAIGTPTYNLAKFLIPILEPLTKNHFVIKDSFSFAEDVKKQPCNLYMASFDVEALFTNIPLDETINICVEQLYKRRNMKIKGLSKNQFKNLLELATKESLFIFDGVCYQQTDGVAMGSPLGPTLANIFLCYYEEIWLSKCPQQFKPKYYQRYVDDIFLLFNDPSEVNKFEKYMNSRHTNMNFTKEIENNNSLSFLDIRIDKTTNNFDTSIYRKPTFSGVYLNFKSFVPQVYKKGLINCLLFRIYNLCSNWSIIHDEISKIKSILIKNKYPLDFINDCIKTFLDKILMTKIPENEKIKPSEKEEFVISLLFLGN